jgi:hypothetical protein
MIRRRPEHEKSQFLVLILASGPIGYICEFIAIDVGLVEAGCANSIGLALLHSLGKTKRLRLSRLTQ